MKKLIVMYVTTAVALVLMSAVPTWAGEGMKDMKGMDMSGQNKASDASPDTGTKERKILYWKAPMDPNFRADGPGTSPMGMKLVPVYADEVLSSGKSIDGRQALTIDSRTQQLLGIRTVTVEEDLLERTIRTVALVQPDDDRVYHVHSRVTGWIDRVYKRAVGDPVRKGELLYELYSPDLVSTQQELLDALRTGAKTGAALARERLRLFDVSKREINRVVAAGRPLTTLRFYAPHSGIIVMAMATDGLAVKPNAHLYDIVDLSRVWIQAHLYESEISLIRKGQSAKVNMENGDILWGKVDYIYPVVDAPTRTVKVRFVFDNKDGSLRPDAFADVTISVELEEGPVIPKTAILFTGERELAFVDKGEGVFEPRELTLGAEGDSGFVIKAGVALGEKVVDSANFLIDSESALRDALLNFGSGNKAPSDKEAAPADHK